MNNELLLKAREKVPDAKTLIILASKRARLLAMGAGPMVRVKNEPNKSINFLDIALEEIAEGLLVPDFDDQPDDFMAQIAAVKAQVAAAAAERRKKED